MGLKNNNVVPLSVTAPAPPSFEVPNTFLQAICDSLNPCFLNTAVFFASHVSGGIWESTTYLRCAMTVLTPKVFSERVCAQGSIGLASLCV